MPHSDRPLQASSACPACGSVECAERFIGREMQVGTREGFEYLECQACGTVRIETIPGDLGRHYPAGYYSLAQNAAPGRSAHWARRLAARWLIGSPDPVAGLIAHRLRYRRFGFFEWARLTQARLGSRILDIGCGNGALLRRMQRFGFRDLAGVDPYASAPTTEPGFEIRRAEIAEIEGRYDVIIMNHVLEHLLDPLAALRQVRSLLDRDSHLLVRIPLAGSYAHRHYGANWVQLDAPRHLVIPSLRGFRLLAAAAGLKIVHQGFDGEEPSLLLSESYQRDLPMARAFRPERRVRVRYRKLARRKNAEGQGDMGVFVLQVGTAG